MSERTNGNGSCSQTLTNYFEERFRPDCLKDSTQANVYRYQTAIRRLKAFKGHDVPLDRITDKTIARFTFACQQQGASLLTSERYARSIRAIIRHALPHRFPKGASGRLLQTPAGQLRRHSLRRYFEKTYHPEKLADYTRSRLAPHVAALNHLSRFCQCDVTIREVTPKLLGGFLDWLVDAGLLPRTAHTYCVYLSDIRKCADPDGFDVFYGDWPKRKNTPRTTPDYQWTIETPNAPAGSLMHFLHQVYLPSRVDMKPRSFEHLHAVVHKFDQWHGGYVKLNELSDDLVVGYMRGSPDLSPWTVNSRRRAILTIWKYAHTKGHVDHLWRDIPRMKEPKRIPEAWTLDELQKLLAATDKLEGRYPNGIPKSAFWRALILVIYDTGIRRSDMLALRTDDLRDGSLVLIIQKTAVEILRPLSPETIKAIKATFPPKRELIFDWPHGRNHLNTEWSRIVQAAGLPGGHRQGLHKLRRTSASHLESVAPGTAGRHLGHLTPGLAERFYIDPRIAKPQNAAELLPRPVLAKVGAA